MIKVKKIDITTGKQVGQVKEYYGRTMLEVFQAEGISLDNKSRYTFIKELNRQPYARATRIGYLDIMVGYVGQFPDVTGI